MFFIFYSLQGTGFHKKKLAKGKNRAKGRFATMGFFSAQRLAKCFAHRGRSISFNIE